MEMDQASDQQELKELSEDQMFCQQSVAGDEEEVASELVRHFVSHFVMVLETVCNVIVVEQREWWRQSRASEGSEV